MAKKRKKARKARKVRRVRKVRRIRKRTGFAAIPSEKEIARILEDRRLRRQRGGRTARKSRAKVQKQYKSKPRRLDLERVSAAVRRGQRDRFEAAESVTVQRVEDEAWVTDHTGMVIARAPWWRGAKKAFKIAHEGLNKRISREVVKKYRLRTARGFKVEQIDPYNRAIYQSRRVWSSSRGVAIGQSKGKPYKDKHGRMRDPKKNLAKVFDNVRSENWIEGLWKALPRHMKEKGAESTFAIRVKVRDKSGMVETSQTRPISLAEMTSYKTWVEAIVDLINLDIAPKLGYGVSGIAARARLVAVDVIFGGEI